MEKPKHSHALAYVLIIALVLLGAFSAIAAAASERSPEASASSASGQGSADNAASSTRLMAAAGPLAASVTVIKEVALNTPEFLDEPGGAFTFTLTISNLGADAVTVQTVTDILDGQPLVPTPPELLVLEGQPIPSNGSLTATFSIVVKEPVDGNGTPHENGAEVTVVDAQNVPTTVVTDSPAYFWVDDLRPTVTIQRLITSQPPFLELATVNYTLRITNTSVEPVLITQLVDTFQPTNSFPGIVGKTWLQPNGFLDIPLTVGPLDAGGYYEWAEVVVEDNEGNQVTQSDNRFPTTLTLRVQDVFPTVTISKTVDRTSLPAPATFNYTLIITNTSPERVQITDLSDSQSFDPGGWVGEWLAAGEVLSIPYSVTYDAPGTYVNDVWLSVMDNELNQFDAPIASQSVTVVPAAPALSLVKSASPATYDTLGQVITYSYTLTNTGNVTLVGPFTVTDDKAVAAPTLPLPITLAPAASIDFSATHTITQADLDAGSVKNTATGAGKFGNATVTSNQATATVTATQTPALSLVKSASPATYDAAGQTITYTYVLKNTGNVTLAGPFSVADDKVTVPAAAGPLAPGASVQTSATYTVTPADLDAGSVTNAATASTTLGGNPVTSNQATATVTATQAPALSLVKSASPATYDTLGQVITYSYTLTNTGNVTLVGPFTVTDDKAVAAPTLPLPITLAPAASIDFSATHTITQADLDAGSVKNTATGAGKFGNATVTSNQATATVTATQTPALSLIKSASPATYDAAGQTITYTYVLKNTGNVTLAGPFSVTDDKVAPADITVPATPTSLAPNASITVTGAYKITQADLDAGSVKNTATGAGKFGNATVTSNQATATVTATQAPALSLTKSASPATYDTLGQVITYTYVLKNTGNVTLAGPFSVTDDKVAPADITVPATPTSLAPNASITVTGAYKITQADLDAGSVKNTATGHAAFGGKDVPSNRASATITAACCVTAIKFYDRNANGTFDSGESFIKGWRIKVFRLDGTLVARGHTDVAGEVTFRLGAGTYIVREVMPSCAWVATTPQQQTITVPPGGPQQVWFGNVCLGAGGGHSPGFWSNKNGEYTINAMIRSGIDVYARLRALDLKDGWGRSFDPCNYTQLRTWLRAGNAAYMPYQLSVQLAAMELNVWSGFVKGDAVVYGGLAIGFLSINDLMDRADTALGQGSASRAYLEQLKSALDGANNNCTFVQRGPCCIRY